MLKNISWLLLMVIPLVSYCQVKPVNATTVHFTWSVQELRNKHSKWVLIAAHRGDWRNAPENSIQGLKNCIAMGIDISEFDLKRTKDGQLIIMHDRTIDRSTTGKGEPENYTLQQIQQFKLKNGIGHATAHTIPSFNEMLDAAKGKIIVNVDKGYEYYDDVITALTSRHMLDQAILNIYGLPYDSLIAQHKSIPDALTLQLIVNPKDADVKKTIDSYSSHSKTIVQIIFSSDTASIIQRIPALKKKYSIWFNALWPEHNGGHDDDKAVEENKPDATWGWLVNHGVNIIQTDRPLALLNYLRKKKWHR